MRATYETYRISQREFPDIHGKHNKANAFRHALWNILIAKNSARFSKNTEDVLNWTERITDWHEEFAPNEELAKAMDLHNNRVGREAYSNLKNDSIEEIVAFMRNQLSSAKKIEKISDIRNTKELIYLEE